MHPAEEVTRRTLLVVMSWAGAREQVWWSFPYYKRACLDVLGTCPLGSTHDWPPGTWHIEDIGGNGYASPILIQRWVRLVEILIGAKYQNYSDFLVIEYDSIFLSPPPVHSGGLMTHLAGHKLNRGEMANHFYHCPWWFDREAGKTIVAHGRRLISMGQYELGSPDVFLGRIIDEARLPWTETNTFSVNGRMLDIPMYREAALRQAREGCYFFHGLRTKEQAKMLDDCRQQP